MKMNEYDFYFVEFDNINDTWNFSLKKKNKSKPKHTDLY